jgi:hypothetical protein
MSARPFSSITTSARRSIAQEATVDLEDVMTLAQAAEELGIGKETLRTQWRRGRFMARDLGSILITTRQEVERYRRESLGQPGRPSFLRPATEPNLLEKKRPPFEDVLGRPDEPNLLRDRD